MSQITIGGTTLNFKDSAFTGDQWEQVASWVLNGGAEGIDANAQIATEKAAAASASAAAARNSATSAGESATAAANSATSAKASEDAAAGSATNAAASATSAGKSASAASERAANAANSASVASSKANDAITAASDAQAAKNNAADSQTAAKQSEDNAAASATSAANSAASASDSATSAANSAASASDSATSAANSAVSAAESIKHAPRINADGKWELWDATTNAYVATEYTSIGENGARGLGWYQYVVTTSDQQFYSWTGWPTAPKWGEGDWLYDPDNGNVGLCTSRTDKADGSGGASITYKGTLKGTDGTTPHIGENGNWYLGTTDTGNPSRGATGAKGDPGAPGAKGDPGEPGATGPQGPKGADGTTPHIGANGNWYIGDTDTGVSAGGSGLPAVTAADAGKFLRVSSSGSWVAETVANASGGEF